MGTIEFLAIVSFAALVLAWAVLPASRRSEKAAEERTAVKLTPVQEN
ncbi:MAG: hypothetical protein HYX94_14360 [Chloroflexi bacterium]|nr:hypothetical protein [Chloroflexota bacterium]